MYVLCRLFFSNETMVEANQRKTQYVRKSVSEKLQPQHCYQRQAYPPRLMIWGCISSEGPGQLYKVEGSMNSTQYCEVIGNCLLPQAQTWYPQLEWIFQQDNAPCHTSRVTRNYLQQVGVNVLQWPPNSPDLNPIETAWALLKKEFHNETVVKERLWQNVCDVWNNSETLKRFCHDVPGSMCKRVKELLSNKGGLTHY
jgi:hypothetical protein